LKKKVKDLKLLDSVNGKKKKLFDTKSLKAISDVIDSTATASQANKQKAVEIRNMLQQQLRNAD